MRPGPQAYRAELTPDTMNTMTQERKIPISDPATPKVHPGLERLFVLRNFGIAGMVAAVFFAWHTFDVVLPLKAIAMVIASIALINVLTWVRLRQPWLVTDQELFFQLSLDVLGLGFPLSWPPPCCQLATVGSWPG